MASKDPEEAANTATDEETLAFKKKRARRVSFADNEITSVHIFKRDDEYDTPPEPQPTPENAPPDNEVLGFFRDLVGSDDSRESSPNLDDDVIGQRKSFLRPLRSPSPGSSIAGSATSNDEDNFFGPVSANFIRPGRLSDSAASDDNNDVTMDSKSFSMHFRSLARSDSGRDLKTPTAVRLSFDERTPTQNTSPAKRDSFMALTKAKRLDSPSMQSDDLVRSKDSNAMSIVGENSYKYDYGRLSPALDALLTKGSMDLLAISVNEKSSEGNEVCGVDQTGSSENGDELSRHTEMENGSKEFTRHAIETSDSNLEGSILNNGTPCKVLQFHGSNLSNDWGEDFQRDRRHVIDKNLEYKMHYLSPVKRTLSAERKTVLGTPNSPALAALVTPGSKVSDYRNSMGSMKFGQGLSSKQKSISKFRLPEPSPCVSSIKEGLDRLRSRLSSYSSMANLSDQPDGCKDLKCKHVDIPAVRLEEQLLHPSLIYGEHESSFSIYGGEFGTSNDIPKLSQSEEMKGSIQSVETPSRMTTPCFSKVQSSKPAREAESPSKVTLSGKREVMPHCLISENPLVWLSTSTLSEDIVTDDRELMNSTSIHDTVVTSPLKATECQSSYFGELKQRIKHVDAFLTGGGDAATHTTSPLTSRDGKLSLLQSKSGAESTSPILEAFSLVDEEADNGGEYLSNLQNSSQSYCNLQLSSRDGGITNSPLISSAKSFNVSIDSMQFNKVQISEPSLQQSPSKEVPNYSPRRRISTWTSSVKFSTENATSRKSTLSPSKKEQSQSSAREEPFQSSLSNELYNEAQDDVAMKDMGSPTSTLGGHVTLDFDQANPILGSSSRKMNHNLSGNKRRNIDLIALDGVHDDIDNGRNNIGDNRAFMCWTDMSKKISADTKNVLPPLINELNSRAIEKLEDTLIHLLKVKEYELLCSEIQTQKVAESFRGTVKRVVEARLLMCKVAYKKAKLQLMFAKRDNYLKRARSLSSHIEDFRMLKLNYDLLVDPYLMSCKVDGRIGYSCSVNSEVIHEGSSDSICTMRQEFGTLDGRIKIFSNYFSTYCKLKGETSTTEILASVIDHLKKRRLCRSICQDLQMWEVDDFEKNKDHYIVLLNYLSYACQRFTIKASPFPSVTISNTLNDTYIDKNFPEMNACSAFAFVLNVGRTRKCIASRHLSKETQMTGFFIRNLLDVIEETQVAQIEITDLILTRFHSPSDEQLDLQLSFIDFHSGRKLTLILDVSDLKRGIYPSEVLPHKIESPACTQYTLPESLLNDIRTAVGTLDPGYLRILRICRCVSEVVRSSR